MFDEHQGITHLKSVYASVCAGSFAFGSFIRSWIPSNICIRFKFNMRLGSKKEGEPTCLMVMAGFQDLSSSRIERQTVPDGYTFGWKSGGENLPVVAR